MFLVVCSALFIGLSSFAAAGDYVRQGTAHLVVGEWAFTDPGHTDHLIGIVNRGDKSINCHIDFYGKDAQGNTAVVARIPAAGEINVAPNWSEAITTNGYIDLASVENTYLMPVIVWKGKVDLSPSIYVRLRSYDDNGVGHDDNVVVYSDDSLK